jgi:CelD/BcsL family acetyltransferase involved in cellulose biosynthesis
LSKGYAAYEAEKTKAGSNLFERERYKRRRLSKEVGEVRFEIISTAADVFDQVLVWKSDQLRTTGKSDSWPPPATRALLNEIKEMETSGFAGMLSALFAGERLIAGHFGVRSETDWHWWFPSYDPTYSKYSPGLILLLEMAKSAESVGLELIDLGAGPSAYKERFANASAKVAGGAVELLSGRSLRRGLGRHGRTLVRDSWLAKPARAVLSALH